MREEKPVWIDEYTRRCIIQNGIQVHRHYEPCLLDHVDLIKTEKKTEEKVEPMLACSL